MRAIHMYGTKEEKAVPAVTLPLSFLIKLSPEELLELKNCGRTTLNEIEEKISHVGLKLNRQRFTDKSITKQLQRHFGVCPYCQSDSINASDYDGDKTLSCKVTCDECDATWVEVYRFAEAIVDTEPVSSSTGLWKVQYRIVAGTTNEVVSQGEQIVSGDNKRCAAHAAEEQIADLDPKYDGRLDPRIEIVEIEPADEDDINPEGVDDGDVERQGDRTASEVGQSEDRPVESGPGQSKQL
jgi:hypothetical protein